LSNVGFSGQHASSASGSGFTDIFITNMNNVTLQFTAAPFF
jgi:hypothetical protein